MFLQGRQKVQIWLPYSSIDLLLQVLDENKTKSDYLQVKPIFTQESEMVPCFDFFVFFGFSSSQYWSPSYPVTLN